MAYNFFAEKYGKQDLKLLLERLSEFNLVELFPVEVSGDALILGISIPFKVMDDPRFEEELEKAMDYLVTQQGFQVTDLFTGNAIASDDISGLAQQISM